MAIHYLFYVVFFMQIFLLSYYYPHKIVGRIKQLQKECPPSTHPKLYPANSSNGQLGNKAYQWLSFVVLLVGVILYFYIFFQMQKGLISLDNVDFVPLVFGLLQCVPYIVLELSSAKQLKLMRQANTQTKRQAELRPRHLFSYISPLKVIAAAGMFILCMFGMAYFEQFKLTPDLIVLFGSLFLAHALFIGVGTKLLVGQKSDPHQSPDDRVKVTTATLNTYIYTSLLISVYFLLNRSVDFFQWQDLEVIFNSAYFMLLGMFSMGSLLRKVQIRDINFDVYRA